jgi:hypothetical protein
LPRQPPIWMGFASQQGYMIVKSMEDLANLAGDRTDKDIKVRRYCRSPLMMHTR